MVAFTVIGTPASKGSARAFVVRGRAVVTNDCKRERPWAQAVHWTAREHAPAVPWAGPVQVEILFTLPRQVRA